MKVYHYRKMNASDGKDLSGTHPLPLPQRLRAEDRKGNWFF